MNFGILDNVFDERLLFIEDHIGRLFLSLCLVVSKMSNNNWSITTLVSRFLYFFLVKSIKKILFDARGLFYPFFMKWNNWVTKKVNIFMWKAEINRPVTREEALVLRSIPNCVCCENGLKNSNHPLSSCHVAISVWNSISCCTKFLQSMCFS